MSPRYVLVLAGGRGERFWPWSTPQRPKQLLPLARDGRTLLAATLERATAVVAPDHVLVLTSADLVPAVRAACGGLPVHVAGEPMGRNTAAAIGAAAAWFAARERGGDPAFAVLPADHAIDDAGGFARDLARGFDVAERESVLLTIGVRPTGPDPSFGYIRVGTRIADRLHRVARFTEKPDVARARAWLDAGGYYWNAGIFAWRARTLLDALEATKPGLAGPLRTLADDGPDVAGLERGLARVFPSLESISIDYAVLEHAPNTVMLEAGFDWDDLGSWGAWARRQPRDAQGNVTFGDAIALDCERCVVVGEGGVAAALGLADTVVVNANGAVLACRLEDSEKVRRVSEVLRGREAAMTGGSA